MHEITKSIIIPKPKTYLPKPKSDGLRFKGVWNIQLFNAETGELELDHTIDNIVMDNAVQYMAGGPGPTEFTQLHIGAAPWPTTPNTMDPNLNDPYFFSCGTTPSTLISPGSFAFQKKASLGPTDATGGAAQKVLTEAGLFTPGGIMFNRILFTPDNPSLGITKTNLQSAFITTTITILRL